MIGDEPCTRPLRMDLYCAIHVRDHGRVVRVIGIQKSSVTVDIELLVHVDPCHCDRFAYQVSIYGKAGAEENFENGRGHGDGEPVCFNMSIGEWVVIPRAEGAR